MNDKNSDHDKLDKLTTEVALGAAAHKVIGEDIVEIKQMIRQGFDSIDKDIKVLCNEIHALDLRVTKIETTANSASGKSGKAIITSLVSAIVVLAALIGKFFGV